MSAHIHRNPLKLFLSSCQIFKAVLGGGSIVEGVLMAQSCVGESVQPSTRYLGSIMCGGAECLHDGGQRARQDGVRHYCACVGREEGRKDGGG